MPTPGLEFELEDYLARLVPGISEQWRGSTPEEVARIERIAGRPLPPFYQWFLSRMGGDMGPLAYPRLDFSARRVLACYEQKLVTPNPRFLLIGHDSDELIPLHVFYDLDLPTRADARVTKLEIEEEGRHDQFETFREMLASGALLRFRISEMPQRCRTLLRGDDPGILARLDPLMDSLGFTKPIHTGTACGLYERDDAAMVCSKIPPDDPSNVMFIRLGGSDAGTLRKILGAITAQTSLSVEVREWMPPLV